MVALPIVTAPTPATPERNRKARSMPVLTETALITVKITESMLQTWYTGFRPMSSLIGATKSGPNRWLLTLDEVIEKQRQEVTHFSQSVMIRRLS